MLCKPSLFIQTNGDVYPCQHLLGKEYYLGNVTKDNQVANQLVPQNNTPANATTVPQTGEYDTYIIAGIAVVVVAIGAFSFINSRRYN